MSSVPDPFECYHPPEYVSEHPKYAIDDPQGFYKCEICGDTFPLIGDTDLWEPVIVDYDRQM